MTRPRTCGLFRHGVRVGLSQVPRIPGANVEQPPARLLLECLRDREDDVLRFLFDLRIPPTSNQAKRDVLPAKTQQKISGVVSSERSWMLPCVCGGVGCHRCCHGCCHCSMPGTLASWSSSSPRHPCWRADRTTAMPRPLPRTRLLPDLTADAFVPGSHSRSRSDAGRRPGQVPAGVNTPTALRGGIRHFHPQHPVSAYNPDPRRQAHLGWRAVHLSDSSSELGLPDRPRYPGVQTRVTALLLVVRGSSG